MPRGSPRAARPRVDGDRLGDRDRAALSAMSARAVLAAFFLSIVGCGGAPPAVASVLAWPPSAEVDLATELRIAAEEEEAARDREVLDLPDALEARDTPDVRVREIEVGGLSALEVVLGDADFDSRLPTVWAIHGRGDSARVPGGPFLGLSRPIRVIVPRGPLPLGEGFMWVPERVADDRPEALGESLRARADQLAAAMREREGEVPHLGRPIVTGFSQGGHLSFAIALLHPDVVSFALPNAGWVPPALEPSAPEPSRFPPIRCVHGADDRVVPLAPTEALVARLADAGLDVRLRAFDGVGHAMSAQMDAAFHDALEQALDALDPPAELELPTLGYGSGDGGIEAAASSRSSASSPSRIF
jgi:phospholipase/carboxylesterase